MTEIRACTREDAVAVGPLLGYRLTALVMVRTIYVEDILDDREPAQLTER